MKKPLLLLLQVLMFGLASGQSFYDPNTIQTVEITFTQGNWDYMMDTAKAGAEGYIIAQSVAINGEVFDSVGVKYKGNSSYNQNNAKNPIHIALDEVHGNQDYQGFTDVKLNNGFADPSMIREALSYDIVKNYMHCPRANYARLYINGTLIGLFTNVEAINKKFCGDHFYASQRTLVKCNPQNAGPGGTSKSNLKYINNDSTSYFTSYEIKSDHGWNDLVRLCDTVTNFTASLGTSMDVDRAIWMLALNDVLVNLDSYSGTFVQNYYEYKDNTNHFNSVMWDLNMSFGSFSMAGGGGGGPGGGALTLAQMQQMSLYLHTGDATWPLLNDIYNNPMYKRMYLAHIKTITNEFFANNLYETKAATLQALIGPAVQADPNKFYTYAQFQAGMTGNVGGGGPGGGTIPGISNLMDARVTYLQSTTEFNYAAPVITAITPSNATPAYNSTVTITANVTTANANGVYLGYRYDKTQKFKRVLMYDDGAHNDGTAGDNVYGASFTVLSGDIQYYIYAENNNIGKFSPERAEHEFYTLLAATVPATPGALVINEIMTKNTNGTEDEYGDQNDWIELYNNSSDLIGLGDVSLTDNFLVPDKWTFPANTSIPPFSYLTVWADEDSSQVILHASFKLSDAGERLMVSRAGTVIDSLTFGNQTANISYGRCPNATGPFITMLPTYKAENNTCVVGVEEVAAAGAYDFKIYPNPTSDVLQVVSTDESEINRVEIYNTLGDLVLTADSYMGYSQYDVSSLAAGVYFIKAINAHEQSGLKRFVKM